MNTNYSFAVQRIQLSYIHQLKQEKASKYIHLYEAIKKCIKDVELPHNWVLPSTRILAQELKVSRTTVIKAYELLLLEKKITSRTGSGYRVSYHESEIKEVAKVADNQNDWYPEISSTGKAFLNNVSLINRSSQNNIAFRPGLPPLDIFPINQWKNLLNSYWRYTKTSGLSYARSTGIDPLKKSISDYLNVSRNVRCDYRQIVVVSGSLQSLYLTANVLIEPGDSVILENPVFPNVHSIFNSMRAHILPVNIEKDGVSIHELNQYKSQHPKLIHVTPTNQYPLGIKMSLQKRKELLQWASDNKTLIIENDYEHEIANDKDKVPTIYSLDSEDRTIYIGTFNRLLHPSIRLGFLVLPKYLIPSVEALQEHSHRFVAPSIQVVMSQFIERNYLYRHLKNVITTSEERRRIFLKFHKQYLSHLEIVNDPTQSLHIVLKLKESEGHLESEVIEQLKLENITIYPLSKCYTAQDKEYGFILGYAALRSNLIEKNVKKIASVFK
jgi:GntR family transcriptional regulator/MocR family aminotransferase